jgi:hypothetical protein
MTLTKYEKEIIILFNEGEDTAHIQTYNAGLRKRLAAFSKKHPDLCRLEKSFAQGGVIYVLDKSDCLSGCKHRTARNAGRKQGRMPRKTVSTVRRNEVVFRAGLRSECRVCTRCFDCNYITEYKVSSVSSL